MPTPEVRFFAIVMNIQQKTGGNLAEALSNLLDGAALRKLMREKVEGSSRPKATSSAMIIGALPPGADHPHHAMDAVLHDSDVRRPHRGWLMLGASAIWMGIGIFVMAKMINFKFWTAR